MPLKDTTVRTAKPRAKKYKLFDGEGLYLVVLPTGGRYWRLKYVFANKEKVLALGVYPHITLADARERRAQARKLIAAGINPGQAKKEAKHVATLKAANTFEAVAREWLEKRRHQWASITTEAKLDRIEMHILPKLGHRPIADITPPDVLAMLRVIEEKGTLETAQRAMQICGQIFMYAIATGRAVRNPVPDLRGALKTPVVKHRSYLKENELPAYLKTLEAYDGDPLTKLALRFLLLTFVRSGELRAARWSEIDWDKAEWRIPGERTKMRELHVVPLSKQALAVLHELENHSGNREFIFPNQRNPATFMSENTMLFGRVGVFRLPIAELFVGLDRGGRAIARWRVSHCERRGTPGRSQEPSWDHP